MLLTTGFAGSAASNPAVRDTSADNEMLFAGSQVVTTASRTGEKVDDAPASVTVITADQIRRMGATNLLDILRYVPDLQVTEVNHSVANVSIRGFNTEYDNSLLVMVDNRPVYNDLFGGVFWNLIPVTLDQIKRIEIVRGPGSALYGANAYQGVINIITFSPSEQAQRATMTLRTVVGTHRTDEVDLILAGSNHHGTAITADASYDGTQGYGTRSGAHDRVQFPQFNMNVETVPAKGSRLRFTAGHTDSLLDYYQALYMNGLTYHETFASIAYDEQSKVSPLSFQFSYNKIHQNSATVGNNSINTFDADIHQAREISSRSNLVYGVDEHYVRELATITGTRAHYEGSLGVYLQDETHFSGGYTLFAGLRYDNNSLYGSDVTPRFSLIKHLPHRQTIRLSYSSAFQAPTYVNSYLTAQLPLAPGLSVPTTGSGNLKPQTTTSTELAWRQQTSRGYSGATLFYSEMSNYITTIPVGMLPSPPYPSGFPSGYNFANLGTTTVLGLELEGATRVKKNIQLTYNYTYLIPSESDSFHLGTITPMHMVNLGMDDELSSRLNLFVGAHFVGAQAIQDGSGRRVPAYLRTDVRLGYRLTTGSHPWTLSAIVLNLFGGNHVEYPNDIPTGLPNQTVRQPTTFYLSLTGSY
jgi:iron complex outermembrane receptor protein